LIADTLFLKGDQKLPAFLQHARNALEATGLSYPSAAEATAALPELKREVLRHWLRPDRYIGAETNAEKRACLEERMKAR
jgi:hypothetical protein